MPANPYNLLVTFQVYEPFYADFGPLNLGLTYRFCQKTQNHLQVFQFPRAVFKASAMGVPSMLAVKAPSASWHALLFGKQLTYGFCDKLYALQEGERQRKPVYFCCGPTAHQRANAAVLVRTQHSLLASLLLACLCKVLLLSPVA